jgi:hypothetical protein
VAVGGLFALGYAAVEGVKAFRQEEQIVRSFMRTVRNLGIPVGAATREMDRMATRAVQLGFDDAETIQGMQSFIKLTGDIGKATELTSLAWDIARSRQIPLSAAIKAAQNIYKGSARELKGYGIEGKKGMEAVNEARRKERGQAREWARNHPMQMRIGQIADTWADLVGNLAKGDFKGVQAAVGKLGTIIQRALFGWTNGKGEKVKGLIDRVGEWGAQISSGILGAIADVDWGKTLSDTLNTALGALAESARNGTLTNIAVVGTALAGAMFAFHVFFGAARKLFGLPGWAAKSLVSVAARAVGASFSVAVFALGKFLTAGKKMFELAGWGAKAIVRVAARAMGTTLAGAMFLGARFTNAARDMFGRITKLPAKLVVALRSFGSLMGSPLGLGILAGIATAFTANAILDLIAERIDEATGTTLATDSRKNQKAHGGHPFDMFARVLEGLISGNFATGTNNAPRGWGVVGERGPELVRFRGGERVLTNRASAAALGGGGNIYLTVPITVQAAVGTDAARTGQEIMRYIDSALARGHRFRYRPVGG